MFFPCSGDLCVAERAMSRTAPVVPVTTYYCLDKNSNPHWRDICNGLEDTDTNVPQCCIEEDCNLRLMPRLPSETAVPTTYPPYRPGPVSVPPDTTESTVSRHNRTIDKNSNNTDVTTTISNNVSTNASTSNSKSASIIPV